MVLGALARPDWLEQLQGATDEEDLAARFTALLAPSPG